MFPFSFSVPPHLTYLDKRRQHKCDSVQYGPSGQWLDVWRSGETWNAPVLLWLPGGAWASASRFTMQGHSLMSRLVKRGWICLSVDYRTAPRSHWPAQTNDVSDAIWWAREHIQDYGGDPTFVAIAGASAGGHLATLAGLRNEVEAAVSLYGMYDWEDRRSPWRKAVMLYLEQVVVGKRQSSNPELFKAASPMANVHESPAPFFMVHGTRDELISIGQARRFYKKMLETSKNPVEMMEVGSGHAFDLYSDYLCKTSNRAIVDFLQRVYEGEE